MNREEFEEWVRRNPEEALRLIVRAFKPKELLKVGNRSYLDAFRYPLSRYDPQDLMPNGGVKVGSDVRVGRDYLRVGIDETLIPPSYLIFKYGAKYYAKSGLPEKPGLIEFPSEDAATVIQQAINETFSYGKIVVICDIELYETLELTKPIYLDFYGTIGGTSNPVFRVGSADTNPIGGGIYVKKISRPSEAEYVFIEQISGQHWHYKVDYLWGFGTVWKFNPVAQPSPVWYAGNVLEGMFVAVAESILYIPPEPSNVHIEGNKLITYASAHAPKPVVLKGGANTEIYGFLHATGDYPDFDDKESRGGNILIVQYLGQPELVIENMHRNSLLIYSLFPLGQVNMLKNSDFEKFDGDIPIGYSVGGIGVSYGMETSIVKHGFRSFKLTNGDGYEAYLQYDIPSENVKYFRGKVLTLYAYINTTVADRVTVALYDYDGSTWEEVHSAKHPGDGNWHLLYVSKRIRSNATMIRARPIRIWPGSSITAYVDAASLVVKSPLGYTPTPIFDTGCNSGAATIVAGNTYVDVPHGLASAPDISKVRVTPRDDLGGRSFWVEEHPTDPDTYFRIYISSSDTVDHMFNWYAEV